MVKSNDEHELKLPTLEDFTDNDCCKIGSRENPSLSGAESTYSAFPGLLDGRSIIITMVRGDKIERACRYIDEMHCEVGNNLFHIDDLPMISMIFLGFI